MTRPITPEDLSRFVDNELPAEERDRVSQWVSGCEDSRKEVERFRAWGADLRDLLSSLEPPGLSTWDQIRHQLEPEAGQTFSGSSTVLSNPESKQ